MSTETCMANVGVDNVELNYGNVNEVITTTSLRLYCSLPDGHLGNHVTIDMMTGKPYEFDR